MEKNKEANRGRLVAGYCWDWASKKDPRAYDIILGGDFKMRWNLSSYGNLWLIHPDSVNEIGCIHTCQGLELDYIGVIIGPDLVVREDKIQTDPAQRSILDRSVRGYRQFMDRDPKNASIRLDMLIKNTYRTLMTRGVKGCYLYCTDPQTRDISNQQSEQESPYEGGLC